MPFYDKILHGLGKTQQEQDASGSNGNASKDDEPSPLIITTNTTTTTNNKYASYSFTIEHFNDKKCDPSITAGKYKNMMQRFQSRHRRGAPMSKLESDNNSGGVEGGKAAKVQTKAKRNSNGTETVKNLASLDTEFKALAAAPAAAKTKAQLANSAVKIHPRDPSAPPVRDAVKRRSWTPRAKTQELPAARTASKSPHAQRSPALSSKPTTTRNHLPPTSANLRSKVSTKISANQSNKQLSVNRTSNFVPRSTAKQMALIDVDMSCPVPPLNDDKVSEAGTYIVYGDKYTEEEKDRMNIDAHSKQSRECRSCPVTPLNDDSVSEAGTYIVYGANYTEEEKDRMNIDASSKQRPEGPSCPISSLEEDLKQMHLYMDLDSVSEAGTYIVYGDEYTKEEKDRMNIAAPSKRRPEYRSCPVPLLDEDFKQMHWDMDSVSEAGTYTVYGDKYTKEEKDRMNIDVPSKQRRDCRSCPAPLLDEDFKQMHLYMDLDSVSEAGTYIVYGDKYTEEEKDRMNVDAPSKQRRDCRSCPVPLLDEDFKQMHWGMDSVSEAGTYTVYGDKYTKEEKDRMNIDASSKQRREHRSNRPTELNLRSKSQGAHSAKILHTPKRTQPQRSSNGLEKSGACKARVLRTERSQPKLNAGKVSSAPPIAQGKSGASAMKTVGGSVACPKTPELPRRNVRSVARVNATVVTRQEMPRDTCRSRLANQVPNSLASAKKQLLQTAASAKTAVANRPSPNVQSKYLDISKYRNSQGSSFPPKNDARTALKATGKPSKSPSSTSMGLARSEPTSCTTRNSMSVTSGLTNNANSTMGRLRSKSVVRRDPLATKQKEAEVALWKRRTTYDPIKAVAEDHRKKEEARKLALAKGMCGDKSCRR